MNNMKKIQTYGKVFFRYLSLSTMYNATYREGFFIALGVEIVYAVTSIVFFNILFGSIKSFAGWSYWEVLLLVGIDTIMSELLVGLVFANGTNVLPRLIKTGNVDYFLLKPIPSYFLLNLAQPYFPSVLSTLFGFILISISLSHLAIAFSFVTIVGVLIMMVSGFIIASSIMIMVASLAFIFSYSNTFPRIGMNLTINFSDKPHHVYNSLVLKSVFYFIIPAIFLSSVPAYSIMHGIDSPFFLSAIGLAVVFSLLSFTVWNYMISNYTSASS